MASQSLVILGSTGSVGESTLDVIARHPDRYSVWALTANLNTAKMVAQCLQFKPKIAAMVDENSAAELAQSLDVAGLTETQVVSGEQALIDLVGAAECDGVMSAIVGAAGLLPTLAAIKAGKRVFIANKEPLVMAGELFMQAARDYGAVILPIDSEHNAIHQCLPADQTTAHVKKVHLTASGGPFRDRDWRSLTEITPDQACAHPNWSMGRKISVDSATMMNKGLELIEATALYRLQASEIDILIHRQSIIHSLVEYCDGSFLAQLGAPDMRIPIAHALAWPDRHSSGAATIDFAEIARLDFERPKTLNWPCLVLARQAAEQGGSAPAVLNAANEVAVEAFLKQRIRFTDIPQVIDYALSGIESEAVSSVSQVLQIDNDARRIATQKLDLL